MDTLIRTELDADGVLLATIDMPGRTMNVFSAALMDALEALMDRVDRDADVQAVVLTSGKSSFLAGADLVMVRGYCDAGEKLNAEQMFEMCGRLGRQMVRLEASPKPWVAAVNGLALGGGLELSMACRVRLVADDPRIQLGLPEVRLGLLPGAGGTQRMPRLVNFELAMDLLLSGRSLDPQAATTAGLFERSVPAAQLIDEAKAVARDLRGQAIDWKKKFGFLAQADVPEHSDMTAREVAARHGISARDFDRYPAYSAIVNSVLLGARKPLAEATALEMQQFLRLMYSPVAGNMVRTLFLNRQRADRTLSTPDGLRVESVTLGPIAPARAAWAQTLAKTKLPVKVDASLPENSMEVLTTSGSRHRVVLHVTTDAGEVATPTSLAVLSPVGPFGRVLEIVTPDDATAGALTSLAERMRAMPYREGGTTSVLLAQAAVSPDDAQAQAMVALDRHGAHAVADTDLYDVATCVAGLAPNWSGGPFTHLWRARTRLAGELDGVRAATWARLQPVLAKARE